MAIFRSYVKLPNGMCLWSLFVFCGLHIFGGAVPFSLPAGRRLRIMWEVDVQRDRDRTGQKHAYALIAV